MPDIGENTADEGQELDVPLLKRVIAVQTGVARLGMDFEAIADLVAREILGMTSADAAIVEMLEGDELVYLAASGSAADSVGLRLSLASRPGMLPCEPWQRAWPRGPGARIRSPGSGVTSLSSCCRRCRIGPRGRRLWRACRPRCESDWSSEVNHRY